MISGNGYVVSMRDPEALAHGIQTIFNFLERKGKIWSERSQEIVKQWDFKEIARKVIGMYNECLT